MGLLLSVLVACVGVIELLTLYRNVTRNVPHVQSDTTKVNEGYIRELKDVRKTISSDLQKIKNGERVDISNLSYRTELNNKMLTLSEHNYEDIQLESVSKLTRSKLHTFHNTVVDQQQDKLQSFASASISAETVVSKKLENPSFDLDSSNQSTHLPKKQTGMPDCIVSFPNEFSYTQDELPSSSIEQNEEIFRRSPSPFPLCDYPQVPRNSLCNELANNPVLSVVEEEQPSPKYSFPNKLEMTLAYSQHDSKEFWTTSKILDTNYYEEQPNYQSITNLSDIKKEFCIPVDCNDNEVYPLGITNGKGSLSDIDLELEETLEDSGSLEENYLDSLDESKSSLGNKNTTQLYKENNIAKPNLGMSVDFVLFVCFLFLIGL